MKISIREAINSGAWFHCKIYGGFGNKQHDFRVKILLFVKKNKKDLQHLSDGVIWEMKLEVVNLDKESLYSSEVLGHFAIKDQDNYEFKHHECNFNHEPLNPKIKYAGVLQFHLPNNDEAEYYLTLIYGKKTFIQEI